MANIIVVILFIMVAFGIMETRAINDIDGAVERVSFLALRGKTILLH